MMTMRYVIHGENMSDLRRAHEEIARALSFPEYYGRNLDALWDMLAGLRGTIVLASASAMLNALGAPGCKLLAVFYDAAAEGRGLCFMAEG